MGKLICDRCFQIYNLNSNLLHNNCPKNNCSGNIIDIDDMMIPIFIELNRKGYKTKYCCSGHLEGDEFLSTYVSFEKIYNLQSTEHIAFSRNSLYIREFYDIDNEYFKKPKYIKSLSNIEKLDILLNNIKQMYKYALSLPDLISKAEGKYNYEKKESLIDRLQKYSNIFIKDNIIIKDNINHIGKNVTIEEINKLIDLHSSIMVFISKKNQISCYNFSLEFENIIKNIFGNEIKIIFRNRKINDNISVTKGKVFSRIKKKED